MKKSVVLAVASIFVCLQSAFSQITTNELPVSVQRGLGVELDLYWNKFWTLIVYNARTGKFLFPYYSRASNLSTVLLFSIYLSYAKIIPLIPPILQ